MLTVVSFIPGKLHYIFELTQTYRSYFVICETINLFLNVTIFKKFYIKWRKKVYFIPKLKTQFLFLRDADEIEKVLWTVCKSMFSIEHGGISDIKHHLQKSKHLLAKSSCSKSNKHTSFFINKEQFKQTDESKRIAYLKKVCLHFISLCITILFVLWIVFLQFMIKSFLVLALNVNRLCQI